MGDISTTRVRARRREGGREGGREEEEGRTSSR